MLKRIFLTLIIGLFIVSSSVLAEENTDQKKQEESLREKIINLWHKDAAPFLQGVACSFQEDVWNKTVNWLEKSNNQPQQQEQQSNQNNQNENGESKEKKCTFFEAIHKAFTGKDSSK